MKHNKRSMFEGLAMIGACGIDTVRNRSEVRRIWRSIRKNGLPSKKR